MERLSWIIQWTSAITSILIRERWQGHVRGGDRTMKAEMREREREKDGGREVQRCCDAGLGCEGRSQEPRNADGP